MTIEEKVEKVKDFITDLLDEEFLEPRQVQEFLKGVKDFINKEATTTYSDTCVMCKSWFSECSCEKD